LNSPFYYHGPGPILSRLTNELFQVDVNLPFSLALMFTLNFSILTALAGMPEQRMCGGVSVCHRVIVLC
jgi:hypothetical protein